MASDKTTADELLKEGNKLYTEKKWNQALECWERANEIYEKIGDKQGISKTLAKSGYIYFYRGEMEQALGCYEKSLAIAEDRKDDQGISNALNSIGLIYQKMGEGKQALEYFKKSLTIAENREDNEGISKALNNIGLIYQNMGEWGQALEYYEKSLTIAEKLGYNQGITDTRNNIGLVYRDMGEWGQALECYEKSLTLAENREDNEGISNAYNDIGDMYFYMGKWRQALEYFKKSLTIAEGCGNKQVISSVLIGIGKINITNGDLDEAKNNLERSLAIAEKLAPIATVGVLTSLSELQRFDDGYARAFGTLESALQIATNVGAKPQEINIREKLADTHISKYIADKDKDKEDLYSAEKSYTDALDLARSLKMPLKEAMAIRGIGVVQAKRKDITPWENSFKESIDILRRLGAMFELQKTYLEYAKALFENDCIFEAEMMANAAAFVALRNDYREPLVKTYLLLGDIAMSHENQYGYYLDSLKEAEFNPTIYVKTCFFIIFRMKKMENQVLSRFIVSLKEITEDESFNKFLDALNDKIDGKDCDTAGLPSSLVQEIESFSNI